MRITTARTLGGMVAPVAATLRMPVDGSSTDNYSVGGIAARVDLRDGRVGLGVRSDLAIRARPLRSHPNTGVCFDGWTLPDWDDARSLVMRAHAAFATIACVGWDVALTPAGPVLIEANFAPGVDLPQAPSGAPLGDTDFVRVLDGHLRRSFGRPVA